MEAFVVLPLHLTTSIGNNSLQSSRNAGDHPPQHGLVFGHLLPDLNDGLPQLLSGFGTPTLHRIFEDSPNLIIKTSELCKYLPNNNLFFLPVQWAKCPPS